MCIIADMDIFTYFNKTMQLSFFFFPINDSLTPITDIIVTLKINT